MPRGLLYRPLIFGLLAFALDFARLQGASIGDLPGVGNFHQVDEHVYRGAQPKAQGFTGLAKLGIKTVLDLRGEKSEQSAVESAGMHYVRLPWSGYKAPAESQIATVLSLLNDTSAWPVFVHCRRGADRTGTAIACYRIEHDHWSNQQALAEAKTFGMSSMEKAMQHFILLFTPTIRATLATAPSPAAPSLLP
jgi:tyrosine-protein phosphatase SIW14